jgi:hypothetical protein
MRTDSRKKLFDLFVKHLSSEHRWNEQRITQFVSGTEKPAQPLSLPVSIFSVRELGAFESIVKFLHESKGFTFSSIAKLTNRDPRTIWNSYHSGLKKFKTALPHEPSEYAVSLDILADRRLSVLESIVHYLNSSYGLQYSRIAKLLNRDSRTIHTVKNRAARKLKND